MSCTFSHVAHPVSWIFFFNDTATTEIYTLSLHDALPIYRRCGKLIVAHGALELERLAELERRAAANGGAVRRRDRGGDRKEHTPEPQSRQYLVCRLLLVKRKKEQRSDVPSRRYLSSLIWL